MSLQDVLDRQAAMLAEHGWYTHYVPDDSMPLGVNIHTHGLPERWGHPDFQVVLPLGQEDAHDVLYALVERVQGGEALETNQLYGGVIKGYDVILARATETGRDVLRVIIPDKDGNIGPGTMTPAMNRQWEGITRAAPDP